MTDVQIQNMGRAIYEREIAMTELRAERDALRAALEQILRVIGGQDALTTVHAHARAALSVPSPETP